MTLSRINRVLDMSNRSVAYHRIHFAFRDKLASRSSRLGVHLVVLSFCIVLSSTVLVEAETILFVDDHNVLYRSGTRRVIQQPVRFADTPVIAETKPWELAIAYCTVLRDHKSGHYQAWYQSYAGPRAKDPTRRVVVCYATSVDGVHWKKPNLGLYDFNGDPETNIVLVGNGGRSVNYGASVIRDDASSEPHRRYKMAYWDFVDVDGQQIPGLCVAFSPDGIQWTKHNAPPLLRGEYGVPGPPPMVDEDPTTPGFATGD